MADRKIAAAVVMTAAAVPAAGLGTDTPPGNGALTVPGTAADPRGRDQGAGVQRRPTSDLYQVSAHAALRPDGSLVVLAVNTDPAGAKSVRLQITGYRPAPAVVVRSYGVASHGISRSRWSAGGVFGLAPSSLTELVLRPAGSR